MRDERFKAVHRGGPLDLSRHLLLTTWAADCAERVLPLFSLRHPQDDRPQRAIDTARAWVRGEATVGEARAASIEAHTAGRDTAESAAREAARATGHAVGTAHMADHAPEAATYALRAVRAAWMDEEAMFENERRWQLDRLPEEVRTLVVEPPDTR